LSYKNIRRHLTFPDGEDEEKERQLTFPDGEEKEVLGCQQRRRRGEEREEGRGERREEITHSLF